MRDDRLMWPAAVVVACAVLAGSGWTGTLQAAPKAGPQGRANVVRGHVVIEAGLGADGDRAGMKGHDPVVLEGDGRFSFANVPAAYDVWVANRRGDSVALYQGVKRRSPEIHFDRGGSDGKALPHRASVHGILRGNFPFPAEKGNMVTVAYWTDHPCWALSQLAHGMPSGGPRFGRWEMRWEGEPRLRGTLVALGQHADEKTPWREAFFGHKPLVLVPGRDVSVELTLTPVRIGRIAGEVDIVHQDVVRDIHFYYRLAAGTGKVGLATCRVLKKYDCALPDVTSLAGTYCAAISIYFPYGDATGQVTKCGAKLGMTDFSIHVGPPPRLKMPREGSAVTRETVVSWTDDEKGVYRVEMIPDSAMDIKPKIQVFTDAKEIRWPDLDGLGLKFPAGARYRIQVSRLSAHASVDELVSSRGRSRAAGEAQEITSAPIDVILTE